MKIEQVKISELKPAEYNPRQMTKKQAEELTKSIKEFGIVDPIIVNNNPARKNIIVGGHQRINVAKQMGITEVPVFYINLNEKREKELNIRLNRNLGEWDYDVLANNFDIDELINWGFENYELGVHSKNEIDFNKIWEGMPEYENEDLTSFKTIIVHFRNKEDIKQFSELMKQKITEKTKSLWHPKLEKEVFVNKSYINEP